MSDSSSEENSMLSQIIKNQDNFEDLDTPVAKTIYNSFDIDISRDVRDDFERFLENLSELQSSIKDNEKEIDQVYARSLEDSREAIKKRFSHVAGQLRVTRNVLEAGADRYKAAEYIKNAEGSLEEAREFLGSLSNFVENNCKEEATLKEANQFLDDISRLDSRLGKMKDNFNRTRESITGE